MFTTMRRRFSNVEGANRFYGTYHEISHILETLTNEELLALTV